MEIQRLARLLLTQYGISIAGRVFNIAELEVITRSKHTDEGNWHFDDGLELTFGDGLGVMIRALFEEKLGIIEGVELVKAYVFSKCLVVDPMPYTENDRGLLLVQHMRDEPEVIYGGSRVGHFARRYLYKGVYTPHIPTGSM